MDEPWVNVGTHFKLKNVKEFDATVFEQKPYLPNLKTTSRNVSHSEDEKISLKWLRFGWNGKTE